MGGCVSTQKTPAQVAPAPQQAPPKDNSALEKSRSVEKTNAGPKEEENNKQPPAEPPRPNLEQTGKKDSGSVPAIEVPEPKTDQEDGGKDGGGGDKPADLDATPSTPQLAVPTGGLARLPSFSRIPVLVVGSDEPTNKERETRNRMNKMDRELAALQQLREADRRILSMLTRTKRSLDRDVVELRAAFEIVTEIEDMKTMEEVLRSSFKKLNSFEKTREEMVASIDVQRKQHQELQETIAEAIKDFQSELEQAEQNIALTGAQMPEIAERKKEVKAQLDAFGPNPRSSSEGKTVLKKMQAIESEQREKEDSMVASVNYSTFLREQIERLEKHHLTQLKEIIEAYPKVVADLEPLQSIDLAIRPQLNDLYTTIRDKRRAAQQAANENGDTITDLHATTGNVSGSGNSRNSLSMSMPVFVVGGEEETDKERATTGAVQKLQSELDALRTLDDTDTRTLNMIARCKRTLERDLSDLKQYLKMAEKESSEDAAAAASQPPSMSSGLDAASAVADGDDAEKQRRDSTKGERLDVLYNTYRSARMKYISFTKMMNEIRNDRVEGGQNKAALMEKISITRLGLEQELTEINDRMKASQQKIDSLLDAKKVREDEIANEPSLTDEEKAIARQEVEQPLTVEQSELQACQNHASSLSGQLTLLDSQLRPQLQHSQARDNDSKGIVERYTELEDVFKNQLVELQPQISKFKPLRDEDKDLTTANSEEDQNFMAKLKHLLAIEKTNTAMSEEKAEERNLFSSGEWKADESNPDLGPVIVSSEDDKADKVDNAGGEAEGQGKAEAGGDTGSEDKPKEE